MDSKRLWESAKKKTKEQKTTTKKKIIKRVVNVVEKRILPEIKLFSIIKPGIMISFTSCINIFSILNKHSSSLHFHSSHAFAHSFNHTRSKCYCR